MGDDERPRVRKQEKDTERRKLTYPEPAREKERLHATMKGEGRLRRRVSGR